MTKAQKHQRKETIKRRHKALKEDQRRIWREEIEEMEKAAQ